MKRFQVLLPCILLMLVTLISCQKKEGLEINNSTNEKMYSYGDLSYLDVYNSLVAAGATEISQPATFVPEFSGYYEVRFFTPVTGGTQDFIIYRYHSPNDEGYIAGKNKCTGAWHGDATQGDTGCWDNGNQCEVTVQVGKGTSKVDLVCCD